MTAAEHARLHAAALAELPGWTVGPVGAQADGRVGFVVEIPSRVIDRRVRPARREARTFDADGTMYLMVQL